MMSFKDIKLNTEYRSGKSDVIKDFISLSYLAQLNTSAQSASFLLQH